MVAQLLIDPRWAVYGVIRDEIIARDILQHWMTLVVAIVLIGGAILVERHQSIATILLPLFALSWAASLVRSDYLIHRQGAYLRELERSLAEASPGVELWETWKQQLTAKAVALPILDLISISVILVATGFIAYGPASAYFEKRGWARHRLFANGILAVMLLLLVQLAFVPFWASK